MNALFPAVIAIGAVLIVATPLVAANLLKIWPVPVFYGGGIAIYVVILALYAMWRRRRTAARA
jgi:hypothetical protein